ncbi:hypothetical protein VKT23_007624 [Stygiomarasmius scandens]|uniref:Phosphoglycerate mutase n=1 Tax=Marasmiellus scandens TaxID=2682957 RepID=A0ABR1JMH7_9AGAR
MLTVTFVRHGESEDNLKSLWAGWKDAPLSKLGNRQATAVGTYFQTQTLTQPSLKPHTIYASPLLRAHSTAQAIHDAQPDPKPAFIVTPDIREQHFGVAEGKPWSYYRPPGKSTEDLIKEGVYPVLYERDEKFPEGESMDDLRERAERAVRECVLPHLDVEGQDRHIILTSHGLCISELVAALMRLEVSSSEGDYRGLSNTAWARVELERSDSSYKVRVTHFNESEHLKSLHVPAVSTPDEQTDETANAEARAFFSGGAKVLENEKQSSL